MHVFFFFKQKTTYDMRISDCSSGVCSSDMLVGFVARRRFAAIGPLVATLILIAIARGPSARLLAVAAIVVVAITARFAVAAIVATIALAAVATLIAVGPLVAIVAVVGVDIAVCIVMAVEILDAANLATAIGAAFLSVRGGLFLLPGAEIGRAHV